MSHRGWWPEELAASKSLAERLHADLRDWAALLSAWTGIEFDVKRQGDTGYASRFWLVRSDTGAALPRPDEPGRTHGVLENQLRLAAEVARLASTRRNVRADYERHRVRLGLPPRREGT